MNPVDLKLDIERTLAPETFPEHPHIMRMLPNEWEKWKVDHLSVLNFRAKSTYHSSMLPFVDLSTVLLTIHLRGYLRPDMPSKMDTEASL